MWTERIFERVDPRHEVNPNPFLAQQPIIHNGSVVNGNGPIEITTPCQQWAPAITFPFERTAFQPVDDRRSLVVRVEAVVRNGRVGVGCVKPDHSTFTSPEIESTAGDGRTTFDMLVEEDAECIGLVFRNAAENIESRIVVHGIRTYRIDPRSYSDFLEIATLDNEVPSHRFPGVPIPDPMLECDRVYSILLTHTSRNWEWARCTRARFAERYSDPNRLRDLPPFESLLPYRGHQLYSGALTMLDLAMGTDGSELILRRCIDSRFKLQHANYVGGRLVLCFEDFLCVIGPEDPANRIDLRPGSESRIEDNWFGGLHTVFPVDDATCIVSSSAADAVLWVNVESRKVVKRWRLPADIYGFNYELTPDMSVVDHNIHNDLQLGHLNSAYPDGDGGCYISTLVQGDIGHVDQHGGYSLLERGYLGCHGVRLSQEKDYLYFSDSCTGCLMRLYPGEKASPLYRVDSQWLHDAEQVQGHLFWLCLGDKNETVLVDVSTGYEFGRVALHNRGANVQFVASLRKDT